MRVVLLGLLVACAVEPEREPERSPELRFELVDAEGHAVGDAALWRGPLHTRCARSDGKMREEATLEPEGWRVQTLLSGRTQELTVEPVDGQLRWARRQGVGRQEVLLGLPPGVMLAQGPLVLTAGSWSCGLVEALTAVEARGASALDLNRGLGLPARVELRQTTTRTLHGQPVAARRYFVRTPGFGRSLWVDEDGQPLELFPAAGWTTLRREGLEPVVSAPPTWPDDVRAEGFRLQGEPLLAGEFTAPTTPGPHPGVVLVHGSGASNRDGDAPSLALGVLRALAGTLTGHGVVVARYDKRGVGESRPADPDTRLDGEPDALAADVSRVLAAVRARPDVDPDCTFLLGHSEGGAVVIRSAGADHVAGLVLVAPLVAPAEQVLTGQLERILTAHGATEAELREARTGQRALLSAVRQGSNRDLDLLGFGRAGGAALRAHIQTDLVRELAANPVPTLAITLGADLQVAEVDTEVLGALPAGFPIERETLPGLDHVFRPVDDMLGLGAYLDPDLEPSPQVGEAVAAWLGRQRCVVELGGR